MQWLSSQENVGGIDGYSCGRGFVIWCCPRISVTDEEVEEKNLGIVTVEKGKVNYS